MKKINYNDIFEKETPLTPFGDEIVGHSEKFAIIAHHPDSWEGAELFLFNSLEGKDTLVEQGYEILDVFEIKY